MKGNWFGTCWRARASKRFSGGSSSHTPLERWWAAELFLYSSVIILMFDKSMEPHWDNAHPLAAFGALMFMLLGGTFLFAVFSLPVIWFFNFAAAIDEYRAERKPIKSVREASEVREVEGKSLSAFGIMNSPSICKKPSGPVELGYLCEMGEGDLLYLSGDALKNRFTVGALPGRMVSLTAIPHLGKIITLQFKDDPILPEKTFHIEEVLLNLTGECHFYHLSEPLSYFIDLECFDDEGRERSAAAEMII